MEIFNYHDIEQRMVCKYHDTCIYLFGKNLLLSNLPVFPLNQGPNIPVILVENCSMIPGNPHWTRANKQFIVLRKEKQVTNQHSQSKCRNSPLIQDLNQLSRCQIRNQLMRKRRNPRLLQSKCHYHHRYTSLCRICRGSLLKTKNKVNLVYMYEY